MKIRVREHVTQDRERMAKVALATTSRAQLDLYCVAPGQAQKPHVHGDQDKIYYVLEGAGRFTLGAESERLEAGGGLGAPPGVEHRGLDDRAAPPPVCVGLSAP